MKTNTAKQTVTTQTIANIFEACLATTLHDFSYDQPYSFDACGRPSLDVHEDELAVSYHADFIGTIFMKDGLWHITTALEGFANELDASRHLLALEVADGSISL